MSISKIAERYSMALFNVALENNLEKQVNQDMEMIQQVCKTSKDFVNMLRSPIINISHKNQILQKIFQDKTQNLTSIFLKLMVNKRREKYLPLIALEYINLYKNHIGIKTAYIQSVNPIAKSNKDKILEILKHKTSLDIEFEETLNKELIGGFVVNMDDYEIDQSISSKLKDLKEELSKNLYLKGF